MAVVAHVRNHGSRHTMTTMHMPSFVSEKKSRMAIAIEPADQRSALNLGRSHLDSVEVDPYFDVRRPSYAESVISLSLASVASDVSRGYYENGRRYHSYGNAEYALPNDERECERLDIGHAVVTLLLGHRLFWSPIKPNPTRILDLGTGTGIWALDCAEIFDTAEIIGTDLSPIQPQWLPPNCTFEVDDAEREWLFEPESFDFIFNRNFMGAIRDWPRLIRQCYDHVRPGGWVEFQQKHPRFRSDDGSLPGNSPMREWDRGMFEAARLFGAPLDSPVHLKQWMEEAGFVDVEEHIMKIPVGPWPRDPRLKKIGTFELVNITEGLEAMTMRLFTKILGWSQERLQKFLKEVLKDVSNARIHSYYQFYVVFGRKPERNGR